MSIILGSSLFIILLASKSLFRNHLFICACAFLLAGLSNKNEFPWLLYFQLSLVYFGAVLNKVVQIDWWNGQFIYNWLVNARENQLFIKVSDVFPEMWLAKILSWSSMLIEFSISIFILVKKRHFLVAWVIILFHTILYTMTAFRFGHFYEDIVIILLIFINWPSGIIQISSKNVISPFVRKSFNFFNFSSRYCAPKVGKYGWDLKGSSCLSELSYIMSKGIMIRRLKSEVLSELPPKRRQKI